MRTSVENQVAQIRTARGLSASQLAVLVGVRRQTIYAIESGIYVPNTAVALKLARELAVSIHELFALESRPEPSPATVAATVIGSDTVASGQSVRIGRVDGQWVGVPVSAAPCYLPDADGVVAESNGTDRRTSLAVFGDGQVMTSRLVMAGCDPAADLLGRMVERMCGVEVVPAAASSRGALGWLRDGRVHIAGSHLEDADTGDFNRPIVRETGSLEDAAIVTLAHWEAGLVVAPGNPHDLRRVEDLAQPHVRFVNREAGSGSRALLDKLLERAGMPARAIFGFERVVDNHLAAAHHVACGDADACLAPRSAARAFSLDFVPIQRERYDLVIRRCNLELPAVQAFLDVLQRASLRRKLEALTGYDATQMGMVIA